MLPNHSYVYLPLFDSVARKKLFIYRKHTRVGRFCPLPCTPQVMPMARDCISRNPAMYVYFSAVCAGTVCPIYSSVLSAPNECSLQSHYEHSMNINLAFCKEADRGK
jgi:hypothetical protein